jgi:hypothetical protein
MQYRGISQLPVYFFYIYLFTSPTIFVSAQGQDLFFHTDRKFGQ